MYLKDLLSASEIVGKCTDVYFDGISRDPENCEGTALFLLKGNSYDEFAFIDKASRNGAKLIVCDYLPSQSNVNCVLVKNARRAYSYAWAALAGNPQEDMRIYGITGTNGKTSTSYFVHRMLDYCGIKNVLIGTNGIIYEGEKIPFPPETANISQMTTPDPEILFPLLKELREKGICHAVMEVSSHSLALNKVDPIRFEAGLFTNFSSEHLDFHKSVENYLGAKLRLTELSEKIIYNSDDSVLFDCFKTKTAISYGTVSGNYRACCIRNLGINGVSYLLKHNDDVIRIESPICGSFTVSNSLAAAAIAIEAGVHPETVCDAIASLGGIPGRLEAVKLDKTKHPFSVFIDYAHTPEALKKLLLSNVFKERKGRLITLFGCGGDRDKSKRALMGEIASEYSDFVYVTSDNPRNENPNAIIMDILSGMKDFGNYKILPNREEAIVSAFNECERDDILLLVGKGHEDYIVDKRGRRRFSEKEIVLKAADGTYKKGCIQ